MKRSKFTEEQIIGILRGSERRQMRLKWWQPRGEATWRSAALSVPDR